MAKKRSHPSHPTKPKPAAYTPPPISDAELFQPQPESTSVPSVLATVFSVTLHGLLWAAPPILSMSREKPDLQRTVELVQLTPEEISRLPEFSDPGISMPPLPPSVASTDVPPPPSPPQQPSTQTLERQEELVRQQIVQRQQKLLQRQLEEQEELLRQQIRRNEELLQKQKLQQQEELRRQLEQEKQRQTELLQKQQEQENKKLFAQRVLQGRQHFNRANQHESSGRLRSALQEYNSFLQKNYPGLGDEEEKARRAISSIQRVISQKVAEKVNQCKSFAEQKKYKLAIKSCDEALREDPQNGIATEVKRSTLSTMQKEFRSIYEDSRLEESMGNIEAAKQKWKKIMEDSFKGEEFHDKSKNLLKKYEG